MTPLANSTEDKLNMTSNIATSGEIHKVSFRGDKILKIKHSMTFKSSLRTVERINGNQIRNPRVMIYW